MILNIIAGLLGLLFVSLNKLQSTKKDFEAAKQPFVFNKYLKSEWIGLVMSLVVIIILLVTQSEWTKLVPKSEAMTKIIYATMGAVGAWAFSYWLGTSKNYIRQIVSAHVPEGDKSDSIK
jgi:uncharacterized membrane protein YeiH